MYRIARFCGYIFNSLKYTHIKKLDTYTPLFCNGLPLSGFFFGVRLLMTKFHFVFMWLQLTIYRIGKYIETHSHNLAHPIRIYWNSNKKGNYLGSGMSECYCPSKIATNEKSIITIIMRPVFMIYRNWNSSHKRNSNDSRYYTIHGRKSQKLTHFVWTTADFLYFFSEDVVVRFIIVILFIVVK